MQLIFKYLGVSDADMEKGQMRVEVNISISKDKKLGTKVEIKNLNSFKVVEKAVDFEIKRQEEVLESGKKWCRKRADGSTKKKLLFRKEKKKRRTTTGIFLSQICL